jgi:hypothetical protein
MPTFAKASVGERSTGCKQTPNGLFIFLFKSSSAALARSLFQGLADGTFTQALISTSTPEGRSSLDKASTVLDVEV